MLRLQGRTGTEMLLEDQFQTHKYTPQLKSQFKCNNNQKFRIIVTKTESETNSSEESHTCSGFEV